MIYSFAILFCIGMWFAWRGYKRSEAELAKMTPEEKDAFEVDMQTW